MKPNIVGSIHATDPPKGTQFCTLNPTGDFIEMFYRLEPIKYNDNTVEDQLQYYSSCGGGWMGTNERDPDKFLKTREFHEIIP